ncbi:MAG: HAD family hydrolase [Candidatus Aenigmatarchaeota archaeon]
MSEVMVMRELEAIIFDMDGVLLDSTKHIWVSYNQLLSKYGVKTEGDEIKRYMGRSTRDQLGMIREDYGIEEEIDSEEFSRRAGEIELDLVEDKLDLDENIWDLIESAKGKEIKIAVATSSNLERAEKILDLLGVRDELDLLFTADDLERHKPHPDIYLKTAEELGVEPEDCVVFEDAVNGIKSAQRADMKVVAIETDYQSREDIERADLVISDFSEVDLGILEGL